MTVEADIEALIDHTEDEIGPDRPVRLERGHPRVRRHRGDRRDLGRSCGRSTCSPTCTRPGRWCPACSSAGGGYLLSTASAAGLLDPAGRRPLLGHQARRRRPRRVAGHHLRRPGHQGVVPVPHGGGHGDAGRRPPAVEGHRRSEPGCARRARRRCRASCRPEQVADAAVEGLRDERFLILPHPEVATFEQRRAADRDRWLAGMRRLSATLAGERPRPVTPPARPALRWRRRGGAPQHGAPAPPPTRPRRARPGGGRPGALAGPAGRALARGPGRRPRARRQRGCPRRAWRQPGAATRPARGARAAARGGVRVGAGAPSGPPAPSSSGCGRSPARREPDALSQSGSVVVACDRRHR